MRNPYDSKQLVGWAIVVCGPPSRIAGGKQTTEAIVCATSYRYAPGGPERCREILASPSPDAPARRSKTLRPPTTKPDTTQNPASTRQRIKMFRNRLAGLSF